MLVLVHYNYKGRRRVLEMFTMWCSPKSERYARSPLLLLVRRGGALGQEEKRADERSIANQLKNEASDNLSSNAETREKLCCIIKRV